MNHQLRISFDYRTLMFSSTTDWDSSLGSMQLSTHSVAMLRPQFKFTPCQMARLHLTTNLYSYPICVRLFPKDLTKRLNSLTKKSTLTMLKYTLNSSHTIFLLLRTTTLRMTMMTTLRKSTMTTLRKTTMTTLRMVMTIMATVTKATTTLRLKKPSPIL